ncbi:competence protein ComK [Salipaludibacillus sp. HK11]|uniref:competence protein ComK n=1 Tax=Salipaludibacillus sp. HK11 TaxID=3394320 RepID=UPI0039FBF581
MTKLAFTILNDYTINKRTMALLPAAHTDYRTIVIEENATYYINQKPLDLIKLACFKGGSSYDGRRLAAMHELAIYKKVPVAINTHDGIYTFPTCSPSLFHCHWIFYEYIHSICPVPKVSNQCLITFKNGEKITINVSPKIIRRQQYRTAHIIHRFSQKG